MFPKLGLFGVLILLISCSAQDRDITPTTDKLVTEQTSFSLSSPAFQHNEKIPSVYTCDGDDINPPLEIKSVPSAAKSLVLIMDDPDALKPAGRVWDHWIIFNIPPTTKDILEGQEPEGVHGKGTDEKINYAGPCPPPEEHRYVFKAYALDTLLSLPEGSSKAQIEATMEGHILAKVELVGRYKRKI